MKSLMGAIGAALMAVATLVAPPAEAAPFGSFNLIIPGRVDFHKWIWTMTPCLTSLLESQPDCSLVTGVPQPVAKAFNYQNTARVVDGRYTLTIDDPFGLRCGNIYYGPTAPTRDVYSWDQTTMAGTLTSTFDAGCDGVPGTLIYPFSLVRM